MKNVHLPEQITRTYFNCIEQQVMSLCYFYHKEYWKLFLNQHLIFHKENVSNVEDTLSYENDMFENAGKYYGIQLKEQGHNFHLDFDKCSIFFAYMDTRYYPFTKDLEEEGIHCMLLYGETDHGYIVHDNFYEVDDFILEKGLFIQGVRKLFAVEANESITIGNDCFQSFADSFLYPSCSFAEAAFAYINENRITDYQSAKLIDLLSRISCMIKKDAIMAEAWKMDHLYVGRCIDILSYLADQGRKLYYAVLKEHLKYELLPEEKLYEKIQKLVNILKCEDRVKREILKLLRGEESLKEDLYRQVLSYFKIQEFNEDESVYILHDKFSVIYLLNHFERCNNLEELDYDDYAECDTYRDFELVTYEKILLGRT